MTKLIFIAAMAFTSLVSAQPTMKTGMFAMFNTPTPSPGCATGTALTLDKAAVSGSILLMHEFVQGFCEIYVMPNERYAKVQSITESCGSVILKASRNGQEEITVTDNRTRLCEDLLPALIVMEIKDLQTGATATYYSNDK